MKKQSCILGAALAALALNLTACSVESARKTSSASIAADQLSIEHLQRIESVLKEEVDAGVRGGFVAVVIDDDGVEYETAVGMADPYDGLPMTTNTRFRIASMTKPIVTAGVMQLVERGEIRLNDPISLYIPAFANIQVAISHDRNAEGEFDTRAPARPITVHHLLTHMAGIGYVFDSQTDLGEAYLDADLYGQEGTLAERMEILASLPLYEDPGVKWRYSFSTDMAGYLIEVVSGMSLEAYLRANLFDPLGMNDTEFFVDQSDFDRLAIVNEFNEEGEMIRSGDETLSGASVNDEPFAVMSGGAGLISTAGDYARFARMLLNNGELDGVRVLSPATVTLMMNDATPYDARPDEWKRQGLTFGIGGAVVLEPGYLGNVASKGEWGWGGYWDTSFFVDPQHDVAMVLMAQTQPNQFTPTSRARDRTKAIVYGALQ